MKLAVSICHACAQACDVFKIFTTKISIPLQMSDQ